MKKILCSALVSLMFITPVSATDVGNGFDVSGNVTLGSDYLWRGYSLNDSKPAFSGGFDIVHSSGLYVGNWNSNSIDGIELDGYVGVSNEIGGKGLAYDIGYVRYFFPETSDLETGELYAGLSADTSVVDPSFKWYHNPTTDGDYFDFGLSGDVSVITLSGHYGFTDDEDTDWTVGASINVISLDWGVLYSNSDVDSNLVLFTVGKSI